MLPIAVLAPCHLVPGPWSSTSLPASERAKLLLANMTMGERMLMLHGDPRSRSDSLLEEDKVGVSCAEDGNCAYTGVVSPIARLGIPPINMNDGPQGFRDEEHPGTSTAWPSGLAMASSWDETAVEEWARAIAAEFRAKGANLMLACSQRGAHAAQRARFRIPVGRGPSLGAGARVARRAGHSVTKCHRKRKALGGQCPGGWSLQH